jgi:HD-like signal output (HDOD) protein
MYETIILEYEGKFGRGRTVEDIVSWVETIPPIPEAANRALRLVDDLDSTPHEIAAVLARDPVLVSAVMRAANSASLGRAEAVTAVEEAVLVVGLGSLKTLLLGLTLKRWNKNFGEIEKLIWEKSLGTAAAAYIIATFLGKTYQDTARLCGLLHNLGQIIMLSHPEVRKEYPAVLAYIREHQVDYVEAERAVIGFSHTLIGAMVARRWQFPLSICTTILRYAEPFEAIENKQDEQVALTKLAASLSMCAGLGCAVGHPLACGEQRQPSAALTDSDLTCGGAGVSGCGSLGLVAEALGFKDDTFDNYRAILAKQTRALFATESNTFS